MTPHPSSAITRGRRCSSPTGWPRTSTTRAWSITRISDEDVLLYDTGHIPGAVKLDWHTDLDDPVIRDYVAARDWRPDVGEGHLRDSTLILYGDRNNWWAAYALWVVSLFGHPTPACSTAAGSSGWRRVVRWPKTPDHLTHRLPRWSRATTRRPARSASRSWPPGQPWSTFARPASTAVNCCTCRTTRRKARCAAATSPAPGASRGPGPRRGRPFKSARRARGDLRRRRYSRDDVIVYCRIGERSSHHLVRAARPARLPTGP